MLKNRIFLHQNIKYTFNWNLKNHKEKYFQIQSKQEELKRLATYLKNIYNGNIPNNLFNRKDIQRISHFKIKGLNNGYLRSYSKKLILDGKIEKLDSNSKLPSYASKVYKNFRENRLKKNPGHEPILKNILIKDKDSIAIEVPIWMKLTNNKYITGHIDLIQIQENKIKIIDYKPEGNFLFSLPQVATYGLLLKKLINLDDIKCISFDKEKAWEYNPIILLKDIKNYLESYKLERPWEEFL